MPTLLLGLLLLTPSAAFELTTLDERTARGELIGLSDQTVALRTDEGDVMFQVEDLLSLNPTDIQAGEATTGEIAVHFADGSSVAATAYSVKAGRATITLPGGEQISASARRVKSVQFLEQDQTLRSQWGEIVAGKPKGDVVVVRKGGEGKPLTLDFLEGALRDVSDEIVNFEFEGDVIPIKRSKVKIEGLLYYHREGNTAKAVCRIDARKGSSWMASSVRLSDGFVTIRTPSGVDRTIPLADIDTFDFSLGKIAFLSDLEPVANSWQPYLGSVGATDSARRLFELRRDSNFAGDPIAIGESSYRKGLALHSRTEVGYRLPGKFSKFHAVAAIDPSQRKHGHVRLEIRGDNRVLFDEAIAGDQDAKPIELDIAGVGRLTVLVDYGEGWDIGDQLLLGGARVIR